jgi:hypothetical protein
MKGLEVTFRNKTTSGIATDNNVQTLIVEKAKDRLDFSFGGLDVEADTDRYYTLDYAYDLTIGDEFVIKIKEIDKRSEPVSFHCKNTRLQEDPDQKTKRLQDMLDKFHALEIKLKKEGLID